MLTKLKPLIICLIVLLLIFSDHITPISSQGRKSLTGVTWQQIHYPVLPPPRQEFSITLNPLNKTVLLFGGKLVYIPELQTVVMIDDIFLKPETPDQPAAEHWEIWALIDQKDLFLPVISR